MERQENTHLIVVVFCSVYNSDVSGLKRLPRVLETVVQLLGDAKSARALFGQGFSSEWTRLAYNHVAANSQTHLPPKQRS